jgi:hypothetical protein
LQKIEEKMLFFEIIENFMVFSAFLANKQLKDAYFIGGLFGFCKTSSD